MKNIIETIERNELKKSITYLYIKNKELRVTYHLDDTYSSYGKNSDYYNSSEVIDTGNFSKFLKLDYRENDLSETLKEKGYFLIGEKVDEIPNYINNFLNDYKESILNTEIKEINRTFGNKKLLFIKLDINVNIIDRIKKESLVVQKILENITK